MFFYICSKIVPLRQRLNQGEFFATEWQTKPFFVTWPINSAHWLQNEIMITFDNNVLIVNDLAALSSRLRRLQASYSHGALLTDANIAKEVLPNLSALNRMFSAENTYVIEPGEKSKSLTGTEALCAWWMEKQFDRKLLVVNLGGGVVTDLGGFSASVFKRGVDFINIPTSLMAMVDASLGGKTGVNLGRSKNQVGTFTSPVEVVIWPGFLRSLPEAEWRSGFAECIKHALLQGGNHLKTIAKGIPADTALLTSLIESSVRFKSEVVLADRFETGLRRILNFGHTAGHGFESASGQQVGKQWLHGEAVAAGMLVALRLSVELVGLDAAFASRWEKFILNSVMIPSPDGFTPDEVSHYIAFDKKNRAGLPRFVLLKAAGEPVTDLEVPHDLLLHTISTVMSLIE